MLTQEHSQIAADAKEVVNHPERIKTPFLDLTALDDAEVARVLAEPDAASAIALAESLSRHADWQETLL